MLDRLLGPPSTPTTSLSLATRQQITPKTFSGVNTHANEQTSIHCHRYSPSLALALHDVGFCTQPY